MGLDPAVRLLRALEAEENSIRYCNSCNSPRLAVEFQGSVCNGCFLGTPIAPVPLEDEELESQCIKQAIKALIRNHRAEFDHHLSEERRKVNLPVVEPSQTSWVEWDRNSRRRKTQ